jgi:signal transduction histidine kinase
MHLLLTEEFGEDSPTGCKAVAIEDAGTRAASLTRQLLAFGRKQVLKPRTVALDELVLSSQKLLRRLIREDVEIRTHLNSGGSHVEVDEGQFERVLMNLAINASEAMPRGGTLTLTTETASLKLVNSSNASYGPCVEDEEPFTVWVTFTRTTTGARQRNCLEEQSKFDASQ